MLDTLSVVKRSVTPYKTLKLIIRSGNIIGVANLEAEIYRKSSSVFLSNQNSTATCLA